MLKHLIDIRLWYALIGIIMSILAHELFHLLAHFGQIERIELFPNIFTIVEITSTSPGILTPMVEEGIAYTITILILFITIVDFFEINDSRDTRTVDELLTPKKKTISRQ